MIKWLVKNVFQFHFQFSLFKLPFLKDIVLSTHRDIRAYVLDLTFMNFHFEF